MKKDDWYDKKARDLFQAILSLKTPKECALFFRDLMTEEEIGELKERWQTVLYLSKNLPYRDISKLTGLSTTTVTRIAKWYNGELGGYRMVIKRMHKEGRGPPVE